MKSLFMSYQHYWKTESKGNSKQYWDCRTKHLPSVELFSLIKKNLKDIS